MAKKAVATFKKGDGRTYSKVIKMVKSPKTGAYIFQEEMIPNEAVKIISLNNNVANNKEYKRLLSDKAEGSFFVS